MWHEASRRLKRNKLFSSERRELRRAKWLDPYGIDSMSDVEFNSRKSELIGRSVGRVSIGGILIVIVIALLVLFWGDIFWDAGRWFF